LACEQGHDRYVELAFMGLEQFTGNRLCKDSRKQNALPGELGKKLILLVNRLLARLLFNQMRVVKGGVVTRNLRTICRPNTMSWDLLHEAIPRLWNYECESSLSRNGIMNLKGIFTIANARDTKQSEDSALTKPGEEGSTWTSLLASNRLNDTTDLLIRCLVFSELESKKGCWR
jgi:hypothetical protein